MNTDRSPASALFAGFLAIATVACSNSDAGSSGMGGSSGSGGIVGTGGATTTPAGTGGSGTGGSSVQPGAGGAGKGGAPGSGGSATGGTKAGTGGTTAVGQGGASPIDANGPGGTGVPFGTGGTGIGGKTGAGGTTGSAGAGGTTTPTPGTGTCTVSKATGTNVTGSGTHKVTVETNADPGIKEGTIYRPTDLGGTEKYPIFVWGNGACSQNGLSNTAAMGEIASHGYFVVADGTPNGSSGRSMTTDYVGMAKPLLAYITWAIAENSKPCSAYYQSLDTTKIASNGFSCGGLMAEGTAGDPRMTTWGITSSGLTGADAAFYKTIHTPVLIILGGTSDMAYTNGSRDYDNISALGVPIMLFSKNIGHGGDLGSARGGDFTKIDLAWLNWWLKGDEGATGKGVLVGSGCTYCKDSAWEVRSKNLP